jgi:hypothetical protein
MAFDQLTAAANTNQGLPANSQCPPSAALQAVYGLKRPATARPTSKGSDRSVLGRLGPTGNQDRADRECPEPLPGVGRRAVPKSKSR